MLTKKYSDTEDRFDNVSDDRRSCIGVMGGYGSHPSYFRDTMNSNTMNSNTMNSGGSHPSYIGGVHPSYTTDKYGECNPPTANFAQKHFRLFQRTPKFMTPQEKQRVVQMMYASQVSTALFSLGGLTCGFGVATMVAPLINLAFEIPITKHSLITNGVGGVAFIAVGLFIRKISDDIIPLMLEKDDELVASQRQEWRLNFGNCFDDEE